MSRNNKQDPKQDFYEFDSKIYNFLIRIMPLSFLKFWHKKLYEHDALIYKIENFLEPVRDLYYSITRPIRGAYANFKSLPYRLKRMKDYAKFAWSTNEYDYNSIFHLLEFKLGRMESVIRRGYHLNSEDCAEQIRIVKELLNFLSSNRIDEIDPWQAEVPGEKWLSFLDDILTRKSNREVTLTKSGVKKVLYVIESSHKEISEEEHARIRKVLKYKYELQVAMFRVICHIMIPIFGNYKQKIDEYNTEVREELGLEWHSYPEYPDKLKYDHNGFFSWWS